MTRLLICDWGREGAAIRSGLKVQMQFICESPLLPFPCFFKKTLSFRVPRLRDEKSPAYYELHYQWHKEFPNPELTLIYIYLPRM